jgi:transglutaminase-like putative cysteine protease
VRTYTVRHRTEYHYEEPVTASYGWACLTPRDLPDQACVQTEVEFEPEESVVSARTDFFGNRRAYFEVHRPHTRLAVTALSTVEVDRAAADLAVLTEPWEATRDAAADLPPAGRAELVEFLLPSPKLPIGPDVAQFAAGVLTPGRPLGEALTALLDTIHSGFAFRSGATEVSTTLTEVLQRREGVCQDFAHLAVATLRSAGLGARYVSGYLETMPPPGQPKLQGADASHAWVSVLVPGTGWIDLDPTNDKPVDESYVVTAWGRDYTDVPPLKGVIFTEGSSSTLDVAVDVLRV